MSQPETAQPDHEELSALRRLLVASELDGGSALALIDSILELQADATASAQPRR